MMTRRGFLKLTSQASTLALAAGRVPPSAAAIYDERTMRQSQSSPPVFTSGMIRTISARKPGGSYYVMRDVDPCPNNSCIYYKSTGNGMKGIFDWCGGDYVRDESDPGHGYLGLCGFGHDSGFANIFPIFSTRLGRWLPVNTPYPAGRGTHIDEWGNWDGVTGQLAAGHTASYIRPLARSLGGGEKGSFLILRGSALGSAAEPRDAAHRFDIATNKYSLYSGHLQEWSEYPFCPVSLDPVNGKYIQVSSMGRYVNILDPRSTPDVDTPHGKVRRWVAKRASNPPLWSWARIGEYAPWLDAFVVLNAEADGNNPDAAKIELWAVKPYADNPTWTRLGLLPLSTGLQWGWPSLTAVPPKKMLAMYRGLGMREVFFVDLGSYGDKPALHIETFGGEKPAWNLGTNGVDAIYNRFAWVPERRAFLFYDGIDSPVQQFQPAGV